MAHTPWSNNEIQFARLISEAHAAGIFDPDWPEVRAMLDSMDLGAEQLDNLILRAQASWEDIFSAPLIRTLEAPLTTAQAYERAAEDEGLSITGAVFVDLADIVTTGLLDVDLRNLLASRLVAHWSYLRKVAYNVIAHHGNELIFLVSGDAREIFERFPSEIHPPEP